MREVPEMLANISDITETMKKRPWKNFARLFLKAMGKSHLFPITGGGTPYQRCFHPECHQEYPKWRSS